MKAEFHMELVLFLLPQQHDDRQRREHCIRLTIMYCKEGEQVTPTFRTRLKVTVVVPSFAGLDLYIFGISNSFYY